MSKQLGFKKVNGWGGKRKGAGRKNKTGQVSHAKRPKVDFKKPVHITMKLKKGVASLRNRATHKAFRNAAKLAKKFGLHVIHYALESNHVHMIVEARNNDSLSRGMKSLAGRLGKYLKGNAWMGRFHVHVLKTPTEMKRALAYVLLNHSKHTKLLEHIDEFSSADTFKHWRELLGRKLNDFLEGQTRNPTPPFTEARSWLARVGWMRAKFT